VSPNLQHQILRKARELLRDKRKWTRYGAARTSSGTVCTPYAPDAVKFCAYGAIARAALEVTGDRQQARKLAGAIEMALVGGERAPHPQKRLSHVNDRKGHAAVLGLFDAVVEDHADLGLAAEHREGSDGRKGRTKPKRRALKVQPG
jgi:hypothetical protein